MTFSPAAILLTLAVGALIWVRLQTLLTYFQQEEYDTRRFLAALLRVRLYDIRASLLLALLAVAGLLPWPSGGPVPVLTVAGAFGIAGIAWLEARHSYKKPLVRTDRARRILYLGAALMAPPWLISYLSPVIAILVIQAVPLGLVLANAALAPMQARINRRYIDQAKARLARVDPVRIGITGSFGKTTVKHILAEILAVSGPVFYSRGSINTELGLTRHIRQRLQFSHRYFIAEMGAYGIGSIARLCRFVHPDYGIITAVGDAHTERFGGIDAIARAKSELAESVCAKGGTVVLNAGVLVHDSFARLRESHPDRIVSVGPEAEADIRIETAELANGVWTITLRGQGHRALDITYTLPLLGEHNVMNSALAVTLASLVDPACASRLPLVSKDVEQIPHRLQKRETPGQPLVLDDAFNSNETGFANAVNVLADLARERGGRSILVTPGIAELGVEHDRVHERLGHVCAGLCDRVYVVNPDRVPSFCAALDAAGVDHVGVRSLGQARDHLKTQARDADVILYENDLPDLLEETRLL